MLSPQEFFSEHFSSIIDPGADVTDVLMRCYKHHDESKTTVVRMGGPNPARFLVTEGNAHVWSPIASVDHTENKIEFSTTAERNPRDWLVDIIMDPPKPPFLATSLGMATSDIENWRLTVSSEMILFSGAAAMHDGETVMAVNRTEFLKAKQWFEETGVHVSDVLRRRETVEKYKRNMITGAVAKAIIAKIKAPIEVLDTYVGPIDSYQTRLAYYAANEWSKK